MRPEWIFNIDTKNKGATSMDKSTKEESSNGSGAGHRPAFTAIDWIIAAFSIALMIFILLNLPPF